MKLGAVLFFSEPHLLTRLSGRTKLVSSASHLANLLSDDSKVRVSYVCAGPKALRRPLLLSLAVNESWICGGEFGTRMGTHASCQHLQVED